MTKTFSSLLNLDIINFHHDSKVDLKTNGEESTIEVFHVTYMYTTTVGIKEMFTYSFFIKEKQALIVKATKATNKNGKSIDPFKGKVEDINFEVVNLQYSVAKGILDKLTIKVKDNPFATNDISDMQAFKIDEEAYGTFIQIYLESSAEHSLKCFQDQLFKYKKKNDKKTKSTEKETPTIKRPINNDAFKALEVLKGKLSK